MIFAFMRDHARRFEVRIMARVLRVSSSGYYAWLKRPASARDEENAVLLEKIKRTHRASRGSYGSVRVTAALHRSGTRVSRHRVVRLMRGAGLQGKSHRRRRVRTADSQHGQPVAVNRLERDFSASETNRKWLSDLTYLPTTEGWLYLCVVLDVFSRRVVGWAFSSSLETGLVVNAFRMACQTRGPLENCVFHSDQGVQYASLEFRQALSRLKLVQSMSRKGDCWDNAPCESFFSSLKLELELQNARGSRLETELLVFEWMEVFYHRQRLHSSLGYQTPVEFEASRAARGCSSPQNPG